MYTWIYKNTPICIGVPNSDDECCLLEFSKDVTNFDISLFLNKYPNKTLMFKKKDDYLILGNYHKNIVYNWNHNYKFEIINKKITITNTVDHAFNSV